MNARSETLEKKILNANFNKADTKEHNPHDNKLLRGVGRLTREHPYVQQHLQNLDYGDVLTRMVVDTIF